MTLLCTGDWQCAVSNLPNCRLILDQILDLIQRQHISYVVHLGDVKEHTNPVDVRVTNFLVEATGRILGAGANFIVQRGNHDSITTSDGVPSILPTLEAAGATIADEAVVTISMFSPRDAAYLYLVPFFRDANRQRAAFKVARDSFQPGLHILAFHNEVAGCEVTPFLKGKAFTPEDLYAKDYDLCIGGHIHKQQFIAPNIWYTGSPFCCDWSEANQSKGFLLVTIPEKITDNKSRRKITVTSISSVVPGWYDPALPNFTPPKSWEGTHVRFKVPIYKDPVGEIEEARKAVASKYKGATLHFVPDFQKASPVSAIDIKGSDEDILRDYLSKSTLPEDTTVDEIVIYLKDYLPKIGLFGVQGLKFKSTVADNVLSFDHVDVNWDKKGLTIVTGINKDWGDDQVSNGAGKSNFVNLPFVPLFGKTFKEQTDDAWARQGNKLPAAITGVVGLPDGTDLKVTRCRRPPSVRVYRNDKEISMGDKNQTQRMIESITNLSWDVLTNSVYIGQREIGSIFGTEKERKELFSRLLGLERFLEAQEKIRKASLRVQRTVEETSEELFALQRSITEAQSGVAEITQALTEVPALDPESLEKRNREITDFETKIQENEKAILALEIPLVKNQTQFEEWLDKEIRADTTARELEKQKATMEGLAGKSNCPTCGSKVPRVAVKSLIDDLGRRITVYNAETGKYESYQHLNRVARQKMLAQVQKYKVQNRTIQQSLEYSRQAIAKDKAQAEARTRLETILGVKRKRHLELLRFEGIHKLALEGFSNRKRFLDFCANSVGRNGLPAYLCTIAAPHLNQAASRYSQIFSKGEINVEFEIAGGDIDVNIKNLHGGQNFKDQSEGETRFAALIAAFALRDVLVKHNILVLDEPANGLDPVNAVAFANGLNSIVERFGHVLVIAHSEQLLSALEPDFRIEVTKQNGTTTVREI